MKSAICNAPCCCILTCISGTYGTNWCLRRSVLDKDWSKYYCCQGFAPCCQECLDGCVCENPNCRACCMCLECICCPGLAISATRAHLMIEYNLIPDKSDNQIIRFNNCIQCLAIICDILAICIRDLRGCAQIVDLIAHIVFCCTAGCMAGQIDAEKKYQLSLEDSDDTARLNAAEQYDDRAVAYGTAPGAMHGQPLNSVAGQGQFYPPPPPPPAYSGAPVGAQYQP
eukprot:TRINITY_DN19284_c0_g2_i2.p2 TRINITY_DN19284_c0_g2~~TRINITY_DN19284_c0_g2_i2.p2  ORF type:complete len:227 (+),score=35.00 TRINITY_DN19284_c0_g2_i2:276-956(+)